MSTHIGDAWRAAGLLPIAMVVQCTGSIAPGPRPDQRLSSQAARGATVTNGHRRRIYFL